MLMRGNPLPAPNNPLPDVQGNPLGDIPPDILQKIQQGVAEGNPMAIQAAQALKIPVSGQTNAAVMPQGVQNRMNAGAPQPGLLNARNPEIPNARNPNTGAPVANAVAQNMMAQPAPQAPMPQQAQAVPAQAASAQPAPAAPTNDKGFFGIPNDLLYGAGVGLLARSRDPNADVVGAAVSGADQYKKQQTLNEFAKQIQDSNLPPMQKAFAKQALLSGDQKAIDAVAKMLVGDNKPYTLKPGDIRYDAQGRPIVDRSQEKSDLTGYREDRNKITTASLIPVDVRRNYIAQAAGMGYDPTEANAALMRGDTITKLAQAKGFDPANLPTPIFGTTVSSLTQIQKRQQALAEMDSLGKTIADWTKPYARRFGGYSVPAIIDAAKGENIDQVAKFLAARGASLDQAAIRVKALGGQVGEGVLKEMVENAMGKIEFPAPLVGSELYAKTQAYMDQAIRESVQKANRVGLQPARAEEPPASESRYVEGQIYQDANGNKAKYVNGQWESV